MDGFKTVIFQIIESLGNKRGDEFFKAITLGLSSIIGADYTYIARYKPETTSSETIVLCARDQFMDNFEYGLAGTPCQQVTDDSICIFESNICQYFPSDQLLVEMGIEGYVGAPLHSKEGEVLGMVVGLYKQAIPDAQWVKTIFLFFVGRISAEMENTEQSKQLEIRLKENLAREAELITANKKVATQAQQLHAVIDNIIDGIITIDQRGRVNSFSLAAARIFGYREEEVLGQNVKMLMPQPYHDEHDGYLHNYNVTGVNKVIGVGRAVYGRRKNGSTFPMDLGVNVVDIDNVRQFVGIVRDTTEQRRVELQLQIRQRMDSLGTLVGGISHDFNNILGALSGNLELLSQHNENLNEKQQKFLASAESSTHRAVKLTKQLQTLSMVGQSNTESLDLHDIAEEVLGLLEETTNRLIKKEVEFNKGEFLVSANSGELHQVLLNLATNSIHAMDEREVTTNDYIRIEAENYQVRAGDKTGLVEGDYIHIFFKDSGCGMSDDVLTKAFDPLFTTKGKGNKRGQGLGLAMVYNIITKHNNGSIEIESAKGKGTTVHIHLPKAQTEVKDDSQKTATINGGTETLLVVDDDESVANMAEDMLSAVGYTVLIANEGKQALEIHAQNTDIIAAVILDLNMPEMSGKQVFEEMLKINPDVRIIISSGYGEEQAQQGILAEAKGCLSKPYRLEDLYKCVRVVLES